jgi:GGDEF domain-containing protein
VSVGATLARPDDTVMTVVKRADEAMYRSKTAGGNCVTLL